MFGKKKQQAEEPEKNLPDGPVTTQTIMEKMSCSTDVYYSDIIINSDTKQKFTIVFMDGLIDQNQIDNFCAQTAYSAKRAWRRQDGAGAIRPHHAGCRLS